MSTTSGWMRIAHPNMEQVRRPKKATPIFEADGPAYDISSLPFGHDAEPDHIVCCDPSRALCGADVTGQALLRLHPKASGKPCVRCVELDLRKARCSDPKCPGPGPDGA